MNVLILHGILGHAGENWEQWLYDELTNSGYTVMMPTLPKADHPNRQEWFDAITELAQDKEDLIIVGHSLGVTSALDYLETSHKTIKGLVSVSGFSDDYGMELNSYFLKEKTIDFSKVKKSVGQVAIFYGDNDPYVPQTVLLKLAKDLQVKPVIIPNGGHLNTSAGFVQFPQLLETVTSMT